MTETQIDRHQAMVWKWLAAWLGGIGLATVALAIGLGVYNNWSLVMHILFKGYWVNQILTLVLAGAALAWSFIHMDVELSPQQMFRHGLSLFATLGVGLALYVSFIFSDAQPALLADWKSLRQAVTAMGAFVLFLAYFVAMTRYGIDRLRSFPG